MQGAPEVMTALAAVLENELTAVNQFLAHAERLDDWGLETMSAREREEAAEEQAHAHLLAQRILLLGGAPDFQRLGRLAVGDDVEAVLRNDLALELHARATLLAGVRTAETAHDYVTRDLFTRILADEEGHADHLRIELELIGRIGLANYVQSQI
jgi:bacterioferritin